MQWPVMKKKRNREVSVAAARVEYEHYLSVHQSAGDLAFAENMHMKKLNT